MSPVLINACEQAWEYIKAHPEQTHAQVAEKFGLNVRTFSGYINRRHPYELTAIRSKAGLKLYGSATQQKAPAR